METELGHRAVTACRGPGPKEVKRSGSAPKQRRAAWHLIASHRPNVCDARLCHITQFYQNTYLNLFLVAYSMCAVTGLFFQEAPSLRSKNIPKMVPTSSVSLATRSLLPIYNGSNLTFCSQIKRRCGCLSHSPVLVPKETARSRGCAANGFQVFMERRSSRNWKTPPKAKDAVLQHFAKVCGQVFNIVCKKKCWCLAHIYIYVVIDETSYECPKLTSGHLLTTIDNCYCSASTRQE